MNTWFLGLVTLAFVALIVALIYLIFHLSKTITIMRQTLETADKSLLVTLEEMTITLKSVRHAVDGISAITNDVREVSDYPGHGGRRKACERKCETYH